MTSTFLLGKARHTLQRWLVGEKENVAPSTGGNSVTADTPAQQETRDQLIFRFMEELKGNQQEWLCRVRMIRFDSMKERMGHKWEKLRDRVELVAEKIIEDELSNRDRYLNVGDAEFLVFFADATPEESRIRSLAIVEAIHDKFFGFDNSIEVSGRRVAECHVAHRDDFVLPWEITEPSTRDDLIWNSATNVLHGAFRPEAEILNGADIAASAQTVIDSIILCSAQSENVQQLLPTLVRLKHLSRSLKTLDLALVAAQRAEALNAQRPDTAPANLTHDGDFGDSDRSLCKPLGTAWDDVAELISVLDVGPDHAHSDLLSALDRLRRERLAKAAKALSDEDTPSARYSTRAAEGGTFEYVPVYRSVCRGERIHQGIYRVNGRGDGVAELSIEGDLAGLGRQQAMDTERATLEHAIQYLLDRRTSARCMLMVAVHINTLRGPHSQRRLSVVLRAARLRAKRRLLMEVVDYGDDDNTIAIRRAIEELRVHSHAVFVRFSPKAFNSLEKVASECKQLGVHAIGIDVSQFHGRAAESVCVLDRACALAEQYSVPFYVNGIDSIPVLAKAIARGVSYVCAPALRPAQQVPHDAEPATLDDLYSAI